MQSGRYDLYTAFHKLLRSRLFDASVRLGRADFASDGADTADTLALVRETLELLADHAAKEDAHVHRLLHAYGERLAIELDARHAALEDSMSTADRLAAAIARACGPERVTLGAELYARFNVLVADQLQHMAQEERDANAVLWAHLTDRELGGVHQAMAQSDPPERMAWLLERLLPVWSPTDRARMWRRMSDSAPPAALAMVRQVGERVLGEGGWESVERDALAGRAS
jgi:hypothetical protein